MCGFRPCFCTVLLLPPQKGGPPAYHTHSSRHFFQSLHLIWLFRARIFHRNLPNFSCISKWFCCAKSLQYSKRFMLTTLGQDSRPLSLGRNPTTIIFWYNQTWELVVGSSWNSQSTGKPSADPGWRCLTNAVPSGTHCLQKESCVCSEKAP